ncbi:alpha-D-ribose 1-methylphosphonate 5-triphosphate diphosphatase [Halorubrum lipolyticum]|uniref:Phosphonate metabolism protein PhnM n=1 Tax=Halorubrum lipolyticum DSM 21995 TaxID=1227482 RepID=M0NQK8_9EURY|nr:alpha-D-ribose 1-methylphosphonate 5-triphosphate diphosphatase [Halorubrum lipolyticum]EMA58930.1 phosphonate metabolism protein PhnM [Halorubrum lipolyticum DSM 21995]
MTGITEIRNGRVVTPSGVLEGGRVVIAGERIVRVDRGPASDSAGPTTVDADGRVVMPGIVDLHGDDIEHHRSPRAGASVDVRTALTAADRANLLNGVTTKFHAVAFEESPDDGRTLRTAETVAAELGREEYTLGDNRLHARCELADASADAVEGVIERFGVDLLSVMHHAPGDGQYDDEEFERHYVEDRNWPAEGVDDVIETRRSLDGADRDDRIRRIAGLARRAGVPLASHDDESARDVERMADHGTDISEYPLTRGAARRATDLGLATVMGAPNLVRGGSLWDNLSARDAIDDGLVDVLCADYHPPSLLAAPFVDTGESLSTRVNRVTRNPAAAAGLDDRGRIAEGARADLIVVDPAGTPTVDRAFVAGAEAVRTDRAATNDRRTPPAGS